MLSVDRPGNTGRLVVWGRCVTKRFRYPYACTLSVIARGLSHFDHTSPVKCTDRIKSIEKTVTPAITHLSGGIPDGEKLAPPFISPQASIGTLFEFSLPLRRLTARLSVKVDLIVCFTHLFFQFVSFLSVFSQFWGKVHQHPRDISYRSGKGR